MAQIAGHASLACSDMTLDKSMFIPEPECPGVCMVRDLNLLSRTLFVELPFFGLVNLLSLALWAESLWGTPHLDNYPVQKWFCRQFPSKSTES